MEAELTTGVILSTFTIQHMLQIFKRVQTPAIISFMSVACQVTVKRE
jgi:hypothetical protein